MSTLSSAQLCSADPVLPLTPAQEILLEYYRCPADCAAFETAAGLPPEKGYFSYGGTTAYGSKTGRPPSDSPTSALESVTSTTAWGRLVLPFDLNDVVANLRTERYRQSVGGYLEQLTATRAMQHLYYVLRPALPVGIRRHLQRIRLRDWQQIPFPRWPVDTSVDTMMRSTLGLLLRETGNSCIPFVWFWPDGAPSCAVMTHDVEGPVGREFCNTLMDLDDSFDIKAAFQIVPEMRGYPTSDLVHQVRERGFEVNLHDLNHDGYLFDNKPQFLRRAAQINEYARALDCRGFRSGAMYREQRWFDAFEFSYDMSVPNAAHLEPQRGGCCTVMPYFVGNLLELPLTTTQDYSLFHIIGEYSIALWKQQIDFIRAMNGFISFITHPDYLIETRARAVYVDLLTHLRTLRDQGEVWLTVPGEVDRWWRNRQLMNIVSDGRSWRIEGPDCHRARLAFATLDGGRVIYSLAAETK
jgi:hypothetical protein